MAPIRTILSGREFSLSLDTAVDPFVDIFSVNVVTGKVTSAWIPQDWLPFMEEAVALENSVVPPLDRTALAYLGRLVKLAPMDDCALTASAITDPMDPDVQILQVTPFGGAAPSVVLVQLPHSLTGFFGTNDTAAGLGPPVFLSGDVVGPSGGNSLVVIKAAETKGAADKSAIITTDAKGRVTVLTDTPIQITESQVTGLVGDLASKVPNTRRVDTTVGELTGGGALSADLTLGLPTVGPGPGPYGSSTTVPVFNLDTKGRVTSVVNTPITTGALAAVFATLANTQNQTADPKTYTPGIWLPASPAVVEIPFNAPGPDDTSGGITLAGPGLTRIKVALAGFYEFTFSPQILHKGGTGAYANMWLRKNGTDVIANSNSQVLLANNNDEIFTNISVILKLAANDYVEWLMNVYGDTDKTAIITVLGSGVGATAVPDAPAVIAHAKLLGT